MAAQPMREVREAASSLSGVVAAAAAAAAAVTVQQQPQSSSSSLAARLRVGRTDRQPRQDTFSAPGRAVESSGDETDCAADEPRRGDGTEGGWEGGRPQVPRELERLAGCAETSA
jgi:hypothetical protein